jgi:hypothetical protein
MRESEGETNRQNMRNRENTVDREKKEEGRPDPVRHKASKSDRPSCWTATSNRREEPCRTRRLQRRKKKKKEEDEEKQVHKRG